MACKTVPRCGNKKSNRNSTEVYTADLSRKGLYWLCENWKRKDGSICSADSSETLRRPVRDFRCSSHSHQVNICYVGNQCTSSCESKLLNILRLLTCRLPSLLEFCADNLFGLRDTKVSDSFGLMISRSFFPSPAAKERLVSVYGGSNCWTPYKALSSGCSAYWKKWALVYGMVVQNPHLNTSLFQWHSNPSFCNMKRLVVFFTWHWMMRW